jgi:TolA-binding protein
MNKLFSLIFLLLLSVSSLASTTVFVINDNNVIRSDRSDANSKNIIKNVAKNQQLQRLTMHYSGWSLVSLDDVSGWILSDRLTTTTPPVVIDVDSKNNTAKIELLNKELTQSKDKIEGLTQQNSLLKSDNTQLNTRLLELEKIVNKLTQKNALLEGDNTQLNADIEAFKANIKPLDVKSKELKNSLELGKKPVKVGKSLPDSEVGSLDNSAKKDVAVSAFFIGNLNANWIYIGAAILFGFILIVFSIYNNNKRRHFDLNTIRRH